MIDNKTSVIVKADEAIVYHRQNKNLKSRQICGRVGSVGCEFIFIWTQIFVFITIRYIFCILNHMLIKINYPNGLASVFVVFFYSYSGISYQISDVVKE